MSKADPVVLTYYDVSLRQSDVELLKGRNWLNDQILSFCFEYFTQVVFPDFADSVAFIEPAVIHWVKLDSDTDSLHEVLPWLKKSLLLIPVNDSDSAAGGGHHWSLLVYRKEQEKFEYYNSSLYSNLVGVKGLANKIFRLVHYNEENIPSAEVVEIPCAKQINYYDCGLYVIIFAEIVAQQFCSSSNFDDCNTVVIHIRALLAKTSEIEVHVSNEEFLFYASPYFLRLYFTSQLEETDCPPVEYDPTNATFTIKVNKKNPGEFFPDLEMVTRLITPREAEGIKPFIVNLKGFDDGIPSTAISTPYIDRGDLSAKHSYGFACSRTASLKSVTDEMKLFDIGDVDSLNIEERKRALFLMEAEHFSDEAYLADLHEAQPMGECLMYKNKWTKLSIANREDTFMHGGFTVDEIDRLKSLPRKIYQLSEEVENVAICSLVDILFAFAYDARVNLGEDDNPESGWTMSKLSSTLAGLVCFERMQDAMIASVRRSLCFPLVRNFQLASLVLNDVIEILQSGIFYLFIIFFLKFNLSFLYRQSCCIEMYVLNELYLNDYCVWIQGKTDEFLIKIAEQMKEIKVEKKDLQLDLDVVETAGQLALEDQKNGIVKDERVIFSENDLLNEIMKHVTLAQQMSNCDDEENIDSDDDIYSELSALSL
ncbi:Protein SHQ1 -like protein [Trichinella papuae]|uniref:Protein SHQ1 homolog n=1 Tax=Trichinella papuae TaxID=268474 RepID=A0A0V1M7J7_9BILA|nr:Protein SHQ1 -like protein [Trichinella papuae]